MTFCKLLREHTLPNGDVVQAYENTEKFESTPSYEVTVSRNGIELYTVNCAKTTWRRKYNEVING